MSITFVLGYQRYTKKTTFISPYNGNLQTIIAYTNYFMNFKMLRKQMMN